VAGSQVFSAPARGDEPYPDPYSSTGGLTGSPTCSRPGTRVGGLWRVSYSSGFGSFSEAGWILHADGTFFPPEADGGATDCWHAKKTDQPPSITATITPTLPMKPVALTHSRGILPSLPDASLNAPLTHRVRYGINSARTPGAWCSWLTRGPVKAETAGSNPVAPARCTTRRSCTFF
jgi:hypothetical protein